MKICCSVELLVKIHCVTVQDNSIMTFKNASNNITILVQSWKLKKIYYWHLVWITNHIILNAAHYKKNIMKCNSLLPYIVNSFISSTWSTTIAVELSLVLFTLAIPFLWRVIVVMLIWLTVEQGHRVRYLHAV